MTNLDKLSAPEAIPQEQKNLLVIGSGFKLLGSIVGDGLCIVDGVVDGALEAGDIKINPSAHILGGVKSTRLDISGLVEGAVVGANVIIRSTGIVRGDISYSTIAIESGAVINGSLFSDVNGGDVNQSDLSTINLSEEILGMLADARSIQLRMRDGSSLPEWIKLDDGCISLERGRFNDFMRLMGRKPQLSLVIDEQVILIELP